MDMNLRPQEGSTLIDMGAYENQDVLAISPSTEPDYTKITIFPNPFDEGLNINFMLHRQSMVSICVYSITGKKIADIVHQNKGPGEHQFFWKPEHLDDGMYIMTFKSEHEIISILILHGH
jgi:hypothetical protein